MMKHYYCLAALVAALWQATSTTGQDMQGITSVLSYAVDMTISSRFARTHIAVEIGNERDDCTALNGFTFTLPVNARVTDMTMTTTPGDCEKTGVVKEIMVAEQEFMEQAHQGKPAALLKAYDATQYGIQVSLPPTGVTVIDLHLEELLHRYRGQVEFQVPLYPGLEIQELTLDIAIQEPTSGVARFDIVRDYAGVDPSILGSQLRVVPSATNRPMATAHLEAFGVPAKQTNTLDVLPSLLRGYYDPGPLPEEGLLLSDPFGRCFVQIFNPDALLASTGALPRNIVFVIDVSGSMSGRKLDDAKAAFSAIMSRLTRDDYFAVQTFSSSGMKERFGPFLATEDVKILGRQWVNDLSAGGGTNLEGAYINGIWQVENMQIESGNTAGGDTTTFVPVVMMLTDGEPTTGVTNPRTISRNVRETNNNEVGAKIYGLAFGDGADFDLLSAISLQNEGRAVRIFEGYGDATTQMENFFEGELGTISMTNVQFTFNGQIDSQTQSRMPIFAAGSEMVTRARILESVTGAITGPIVSGCTTRATTRQGISTWETGISPADELQLLPNNRNECIQSFAHQKIAELLLFRDAARKLGTEMNDWYPLYALQNGMASSEVSRVSGANTSGGHMRRRQQEYDMVGVVEEEALQLALEAAVVWPGLTAMVTVDSASCAQMFEEYPICFAGDGDGSDGEDEEMEAGERYDGASTGAPTAVGTIASTDISHTPSTHTVAPTYTMIGSNATTALPPTSGSPSDAPNGGSFEPPVELESSRPTDSSGGGSEGDSSAVSSGGSVSSVSLVLMASIALLLSIAPYI